LEPGVEVHGAADADDKKQAILRGNNLAQWINGT